MNEVYLWYLLAVQKIHQVDSRVKQTCLTTIQAPGLGKNTDGTLLQDQKKILGIEIAYIVHSIVYILYIYIHNRVEQAKTCAQDVHDFLVSS